MQCILLFHTLSRAGAAPQSNSWLSRPTAASDWNVMSRWLLSRLQLFVSASDIPESVNSIQSISSPLSGIFRTGSAVTPLASRKSNTRNRDPGAPDSVLRAHPTSQSSPMRALIHTDVELFGYVVDALVFSFDKITEISENVVSSRVLQHGFDESFRSSAL